MSTRRYVGPLVYTVPMLSLVGILYQVGFPSAHVLLLLVQHDCCTDQGRVELGGTAE